MFVWIVIRGEVHSDVSGLIRCGEGDGGRVVGERLDPHQRKYAERAELVYWGPWEQLIAHGKNGKESAEMLSWGCVWLIER